MRSSQDFKDEQQLFRKIEAEGLRLFFYQRLWLPVVAVQMNTEEVAHEEHDFTHVTILELLNAPFAQNVEEYIALSNLMGLAEVTVQEKIRELFALGYVERSVSGKLTITSLGERTIALGKPIRKITRSLRLCAVSQRWLPTQAYNRPFKSVENMSANDFSFVVVARPHTEVSLMAVDAIQHMKQQEKNAVNIPDECIHIEPTEDYEPGFQHCKLVIVGKTNPERAWAQFGEEFLELPWADLKGEALLPTLTKRPSRLQPDLQTIKSVLARDGVEVDEEHVVQDDAYGQIRIHASQINASWFVKTTHSFIFNLARCATKNMQAWPFHRYPISSKDMLGGKGLTIDISSLDNNIQHLAEVLRKYHLLSHDYFRRKANDLKVKSVKEYLQQSLSVADYECLVQAAEKLPISRIDKLLRDERDKEIE